MEAKTEDRVAGDQTLPEAMNGTGAERTTQLEGCLVRRKAANSWCVTRCCWEKSHGTPQRTTKSCAEGKSLWQRLSVLFAQEVSEISLLPRSRRLRQRNTFRTAASGVWGSERRRKERKAERRPLGKAKTRQPGARKGERFESPRRTATVAPARGSTRRSEARTNVPRLEGVPEGGATASGMPAAAAGADDAATLGEAAP